MRTTEKRQGGRQPGAGGRLRRSATVTIRLDPKLRYLTELAARTQRRTVSSFIEWAIAQALGNTALDGGTIASHAEVLWEVDAPDRLAILAQHYPALMTYDEQCAWKTRLSNHQEDK